jgi:hypothetical protein
MEVLAVLATMGALWGRVSDVVLPASKEPSILSAHVEVISPTPTPTATPTPIPTNTPTPTHTPIPSPTATPVPTVILVTGSDLDGWFERYAHEYGVSRDVLFTIAACESGLRANAVNGPYLGMFQYHAHTWSSTRRAMGLDPNPDLRAHAEESIKTTAFKIANGGRGAWPNCGI